jgi:hypothetical protein
MRIPLNWRLRDKDGLEVTFPLAGAGRALREPVVRNLIPHQRGFFSVIKLVTLDTCLIHEKDRGRGVPAPQPFAAGRAEVPQPNLQDTNLRAFQRESAGGGVWMQPTADAAPQRYERGQRLTGARRQSP